MRELNVHGCRVDEALERAATEYNSVVQSGRPEAITVIHGFHGHALRDALREFLQRRSIQFHNGANDGRTVIVPGRGAASLQPADIPRPLLHRFSARVRRREIFREIVVLQDQQSNVLRVRKQIALKYRMPLQQIREIEIEGVREQWPPLGP